MFLLSSGMEGASLGLGISTHDPLEDRVSNIERSLSVVTGCDHTLGGKVQQAGASGIKVEPFVHSSRKEKSRKLIIGEQAIHPQKALQAWRRMEGSNVSRFIVLKA